MTDNKSQAKPPQRPPAAGLLVVSEANPRYFTVASGNAADRKAV
jgi:hypothetical protein